MSDKQTLAQANPGGCFLAFNGEINRRSAEQLVLLCSQAWGGGFAEVALCLNSPGGTLEHAYYAFNMLEALPIRIVTYNTSAIQSAANMVYLCGDERYACPGSTFFFHQTRFFEPDGQVMTEALATERLKAIRLEDARTAQIIANKTAQTLECVRGWQTGEFLMTADEAIGHGVVHAVRALAIPDNALFSQIVLQD